jgi:hypothetical protein
MFDHVISVFPRRKFTCTLEIDTDKVRKQGKMKENKKGNVIMVYCVPHL